VEEAQGQNFSVESKDGILMETEHLIYQDNILQHLLNDLKCALILILGCSTRVFVTDTVTVLLDRISKLSTHGEVI